MREGASWRGQATRDNTIFPNISRCDTRFLSSYAKVLLLSNDIPRYLCVFLEELDGSGTKFSKDAWGNLFLEMILRISGHDKKFPTGALPPEPPPIDVFFRL